MARVIEASGGVVEALKRYDRNLSIRWSWQKGKWALESPSLRPDLMVPPVRFERIPGTTQFIEHRESEYSERKICWERKTHVICWFRDITWELLEMIVTSDTKRFKRRLDFFKSVEMRDAARDADADRYEADVRREAFGFYKWACRQSPMAY